MTQARAARRALPARRLWRRLALLAFAALLLAAPAATGTAPRPVRQAPIEVLSGLEAGGDASIARDCGYSQALPASPRRSLWLFCDTPVYIRDADSGHAPGWALAQFISGSTAAVGVIAAGPAGDLRPGGLAELPAPGGAGAGTRRQHALAAFLPAPAGLVTLAGRRCDLAHGAYAASWISGVTRIPGSADLLVTFNDYCVMTGLTPGFLHEGFGLAEYDPVTNTLSSRLRLFPGIDRGGALSLGSPVFSHGFLYLFGPTCTDPGIGSCGAGTISVARVGAMPLDWGDPLGYRWWSGSLAGGWTSDPGAAGSIIRGARPYAVNVASFSRIGRGLVLVEQTDVAGRFNVYESATTTGTWTRVRGGRVPCGASRGGYADLCRAIIGHPEFSTRSRLALSYFDPGASVHGHVMLDTFAW